MQPATGFYCGDLGAVDEPEPLGRGFVFVAPVQLETRLGDRLLECGLVAQQGCRAGVLE
jgi:hypothetical protein